MQRDHVCLNFPGTTSEAPDSCEAVFGTRAIAHNTYPLSVAAVTTPSSPRVDP